MYSTCLYCTKDLGANEVLETLPIGRRVAFDAAQGRLWVICRGCEKWNLVPFDTRLETIDTCERIFSETRLRYSTDNIGIARLSEGLELVRVGAAQRPEFAAWRYGDQFGKRRKVRALQWAGSAVAVGGVVLTRHALLPLAGGSGLLSYQLFNWGNILYQRRRAVVRLPEQDGVGGVMTPMQVKKARIVARGGAQWALSLPVYRSSRGGFATGFTAVDTELEGDHAIAALGRVLPRVNGGGASAQKVRDAVGVLEGRQSIVEMLRLSPQGAGSRYEAAAARLGFGIAARLANIHPRAAAPPAPTPRPLRSAYLLGDLPPVARLALEMFSHEDTERVSLAGELKLLEREWKQADALAKIADSLAVSDDVDRQVSGGT